MNLKRVGILRGGIGENYKTSLQKGGMIIAHILENLGNKYKTVDILIDKDGVWHLNGIPVMPADLANKVDVVWNVAHQNSFQILENLSIPIVGSGSFFGALENNNELLRNHIKKMGVNMPRSIVLPVYQEDFDGPREKYAIKKAKEIHEKFGAPWIVKSFGENGDIGPVRGREGSQRPSASNGMGMHVAKTFGELVAGIEDGVKHGKSILVEEFILGKVASVHSLPNFRNYEVYTFPFGKFATSFSAEEKDELINFAKDLRRHLDAKHYLKSDFILSPTRGIFLLGIESTPDLRENSHFCEACDSTGVKMYHVIEHILENTL